MYNLEKFLHAEAETQVCTYKDDRKVYDYHINPDAINGDDWLNNGTSYIWKVGVLVLTDRNKCDWVNVLVGVQRSPEETPYLIGKLNFPEGENDDCGRVLSRAMNLIKYTYPIFEELP